MDKRDERQISCCFTGHRPIKLESSAKEIKSWLECKIDEAIKDGYRVFITGCAMGVDMWAGQIVLQRRETNPDIRLIAACPWEAMADHWEKEWKDQYDELLRRSDQVVQIGKHYSKGIYHLRNTWMVDHSNRLIAYYNGTPGGTEKTIKYAKKSGLEIVQWGMCYKTERLSDGD